MDELIINRIVMDAIALRNKRLHREMVKIYRWSKTGLAIYRNKILWSFAPSYFYYEKDLEEARRSKRYDTYTIDFLNQLEEPEMNDWYERVKRRKHV